MTQQELERFEKGKKVIDQMNYLRKQVEIVQSFIDESGFLGNEAMISRYDSLSRATKVKITALVMAEYESYLNESLKEFEKI